MSKTISFSLGSVILGIFFCSACSSNNSSSDANLFDSSDALDGHEEFEDQTPPTFTGVLKATPGDNSVELSWNPASDDTDPSEVLVYDVYFSKLSGDQAFDKPPYATTSAGALGTTVNRLGDEGPYYFVVRARDTAGNQDSNRIEKVGWVRPVRYVSAAALGDGLSKDQPMGNLGEAMLALESNVTSKVYVSAGTFAGPFQLVRGLQLMGGYSADFLERDPTLHETILEGNGQPDVHVVTAADNGLIEGFTIRGALGKGVGIYACEVSPTISKNLITGNSQNGIFIGANPGASIAHITDNLIVDNGSLDCQQERIEICPNRFLGGSRPYSPCGGIAVVAVLGNVVARVTGNQIRNNLGYGMYFELHQTLNQFTIENNDISKNSASGFYTQIEGNPVTQEKDGTFYLNSDIRHNAFQWNLGHGLELLAMEGGFNRSLVENNWFALNRKDGLLISSVGFVGTLLLEGVPTAINLPSHSSPTIKNNIIMGNSEQGIETEAHGDIFSEDPQEQPRMGSATIESIIENNLIIGNRLVGLATATADNGVSTPAIQNSIFMYNGSDLKDLNAPGIKDPMAFYCDLPDQNPPPDPSNLAEDPKFMHCPGLIDFTSAVGTVESIEVADNSMFQEATVLEIDADGVARTILSREVSGTTIKFSPPRELPVEAGTAVFGWKDENISPDFQLQSDSPVIDKGNPDPAYQDAIPPGLGTVLNDQGAYGGPSAGSMGPER